MLHANIVIADKDTKFVSMLKARFEKGSFSVYCASDIQGMIEILDNHWVDLLVLGTGLKGVKNNIEILKKLRKKKNFKTLPVVINTEDKIMDKKEYKSLGVLNFFVRPFSLDLFIDEIKDILAKKILIFGHTKTRLEALAVYLQKTGYHIDLVMQPSTFFAATAVKWYSLIVMEYSCRKHISDKMVSVAKGSLKNEKTPIIVFNGSETKTIEAETKRKMKFFDVWSEKMGNCQLLQKPFSMKRIKKFISDNVDFFS